MTKFDPIAAAKAAAKKSADLTKPVTGGGGGGYTPPVEGPTRLRFIGYVELGTHAGSAMYPAPKPRVKLIFELSGRNHPPTVSDDGTKYPTRMDFEITVSNHEKSNYIKLFNVMNHRKEATTFPELLGEAYLGRVYHNESKGKTYANLNASGQQPDIKPPFVLNPETDEYQEVKIDQPISDLRLFLWDFASKPMWDSLFIDGEWEERKDEKGNVIAAARSKNVFQDKIRSALNFDGSLAQEVADTGGLELPEEPEVIEQPEKKAKPAAKAKVQVADIQSQADFDDDIPF